jgi:hypothetical protein
MRHLYRRARQALDAEVVKEHVLRGLVDQVGFDVAALLDLDPVGQLLVAVFCQ